jgi:hypothetical protein
VNLKALPIRFISIYLILLGSDTIRVGTLDSYKDSKLIYFLAAYSSNISIQVWISSFRSNSSSLIKNLPAFIIAMSSRSFDRLSRYLLFSKDDLTNSSYFSDLSWDSSKFLMMQSRGVLYSWLTKDRVFYF